MNPGPETPAWGAVVLPDGGVRFRIWAPAAGDVQLALATGHRQLESEGGGWFSRTDDDVRPGDSYAYVIDGRAPRPSIT